MVGKAKRYFSYVKRFVRSPRKGEVLDTLFEQIRQKGLVSGVQSLLHIKSGNFEMDANDPYYDDGALNILTFDGDIHLTLPAEAQPRVSIIIPCYNQLEFTHNCVRSIYENAGFDAYEIIIADDNSSESQALLQKSFTNLIVIRNESNLGFLKNCNNAAKHAKGELIVFLNNDTQVQRGWLQELVWVFDNVAGTGIAGSKLIYEDGTLQEAGGIIWKDGRGHNFGNTGQPGKPAYNYIKEADYISGASLMISAKLWKEAGGFDERFTPAYCEDSDLCFTARALGYKVIYQPFSSVLHFEGISHGTDTRSGVKQYQVINKEKFRKKWAAELAKKAAFDTDIFQERDRSSSKKHVLVIDHDIPRPDEDAGSRTISNFMYALRAADCHVIFLSSNTRPPQKYVHPLQRIGVEVLYGSEFSYPEHKWEKYLKQYGKYLDAIIMSRSSICMPILEHIQKKKYHLNTIYYGHDLGYLTMEQEAKLSGDAKWLRMAEKIKGDEDYMYHNATQSLAISFEEIKLLKQYVTKPIHYIPPFYFDTPDIVPGYAEREGILFVGGFNHPPNVDAMKWFLDEVYPLLETHHIPFTIAGSKMPQLIYDYQAKYPLLTVKANVPREELLELYDRTRLAVVPLRLGAGVKGKVIEAMSRGVPIAGTTRAFEGIPKNNDFPYQGIDNAAELAKEIATLCNDNTRWDNLSFFGTSYVKEYYNEAKMREVLIAAVSGQIF